MESILMVYGGEGPLMGDHLELPRFCGQFAILFFHRWW